MQSGKRPAASRIASGAPNIAPAVVQPGDLQAQVGFALAFVAVLVRFGYLHEILVVLVNAKLYLLYVFAAPALFAAVLNGGVGRALRGRPTLYWIGFTAWIAAVVPFAVYRSGAFHTVVEYVKVGPVVLLTIVGLVVTWQHCRAMMWAFGLACGISTASGLVFGRQMQGGERMALEFGSIKNSNDFAAHLLMLAPFLLWLVLSRRPAVFRMAALAAFAVALYYVVRTASRGAMLALLVDLVVLLWRGTMRQRIALCVAVPLAAVSMSVLVPSETWQRLRSFSAEGVAGSNAIAQEAASSATLRQHLWQMSFQYAIQHPVFGVGPGLFSLFEGSHEKTVGTHGYYMPAHNSYGEVASECGFPGLLFFIAGILSTLRLLNTTCKKARRHPKYRDIQTMTLCVMLSTVGFSIAATFLSLAYTFYLPALAALAVAISGAADREFAVRTAPAPVSGIPTAATRIAAR